MGIYDIQRVKPPTHFIWHHAVSPDMRGWSDQQVADWFNTIGRTRTYNSSGYSHSDHYDLRTGLETFSAVPIALVPNGDKEDIYSDTWRIVEIFDWYNSVGWHAGNWDINCRSVGCETAGRFDDKELPNNAVKALAEWMRNNIHRANGGSTVILGHKQIVPTACPGYIMDKIPLLQKLLSEKTPDLETKENAIYRLWNTKRFRHFYTANSYERNSLLLEKDSQWNYEGIAFFQDIETGSAIHRFYNKYEKSHFYTIDSYEKEFLINYNSDWAYEGIAFYADQFRTKDNSPLYRFYSPIFKTHFYTKDENEKNELLLNKEWQYEEIAFYVK